MWSQYEFVPLLSRPVWYTGYYDFLQDGTSKAAAGFGGLADDPFKAKDPFSGANGDPFQSADPFHNTSNDDPFKGRKWIYRWQLNVEVKSKMEYQADIEWHGSRFKLVWTPVVIKLGVGVQLCSDKSASSNSLVVPWHDQLSFLSLTTCERICPVDYTYIIG